MIELKNLTRKSAEYKQVKRLYRTAFPANERAPMFLMMSRAKKGKGDFFSAFDKGKYTGLVYAITNEKTAYIFFLAIADEQRGKGYGSAVLEAIKSRYAGKRIFLAIEELDENADNYEQRLSRRHFYEKNGLTKQSCKLREITEIYDVMSYGGMVTDKEFKELMKGWLGGFLSRFFTFEIITINDEAV